jgi:hypothetical protein
MIGRQKWLLEDGILNMNLRKLAFQQFINIFILVLLMIFLNAYIRIEIIEKEPIIVIRKL